MFASCVLLGRDVSSFAPYRPTLGKAWAERIGQAAGTTPGERYAALLSLCDGLRERWTDEEPPLRDRLDAQGLGWVVLKWAPPDTWPPMKRAELQHWREGRTGEVRVERGAGSAPPWRMPRGRCWVPVCGGRPRRWSAGCRSWSVENAQDLAARFTTGEGGQRFADRLDPAARRVRPTGCCAWLPSCSTSGTRHCTT